MGKFTICMLIFCLIILGPYYFMAVSLAQSNGGSTGVNESRQLVPTAMIVGYVVDETGNQVPGTTVTLWTDGHLWQHGKYTRVWSNINPGVTDIDNAEGSNDVGYFLFGFVDPGQYSITAEKDGFSGKANVTISNDTLRDWVTPDFNNPSKIPVNVTLTGYFVPQYSSLELVYTGAITGKTYDKKFNSIPHVTVSLWQNDTLVKIPKNPQRSSKGNWTNDGIYLFEHIAPGQYQIIVEASDSASRVYKNNTWVIVSNTTVKADLGIIDFPMNYLPTNLLTPHPSVTAVATQNPTETPTPTPSPAALSPILVLPAIFLAAIIVGRLRKSP